MYRQENGITDHYSLFLRKSRYYTCKLYRSAESWLRMFLSCSFFCPFFSGPPFFLSFFLFVRTHAFLPSKSIPMNCLEGRETIVGPTMINFFCVATWKIEPVKFIRKNETLDSEMEQSFPFTFDTPWRTELSVAKFHTWVCRPTMLV